MCFLFRRSDNQFSGIAVRDSVGGAEFIGEAISADTMLGFERGRRVVQTGVYDSTVARTGAHPEFGQGFDQENFGPGGRERASDSASDHSAADDHYICSIH